MMFSANEHNARRFTVLAILSVILLAVACDQRSSNQAVQAPDSAPRTATAIATPTYYFPTWMVGSTYDVPPTHDYLLDTPQPTYEDSNSTPLPVLTPTPVTPEGKIADDLKQEMISGQTDIRFMVLLTTQADVSNPPVGTDAAEYAATKRRETAERTQPIVEASIIELKNKGIVVEYEKFTLVNSFYVKGNAEAVKTLSQRNDIAHLYLVPEGYQIQDPPASGTSSIPTPPAEKQTPTTTTQSMQPLATPTPIIPWNINLVSAPSVWSQGYRGQGITVGIVDSGVEYIHPSLMKRFRGYNAAQPSATPSLLYNWKDCSDGPPCTSPGNNLTPTDNNLLDHGTSVTSVVLGSDTTYTLGVAPEAYWIACKIAYNPSTGIDPVTIYKCLSWMSDPTEGTPVPNPHPRYPPYIVNMSINTSVFDPYLADAIHNLLYGGIVPVISDNEFHYPAGTPLPTPAPWPQIGSPDSYRESYSVGAVAYSTPGGTPTVAFYSARGPIPSGTPTVPTNAPFTTLVKPDVVAPGGSAGANGELPFHDVIVAVPTHTGNIYGFKPGTSFAAPHVAGIAALIQGQARSRGYPKTAEELEYYISHGTIDHPGNQPDNTYGYGLVNAAGSFNILYEPGRCNPHYGDLENYQWESRFYANFLTCGGIVSGFYNPYECVGTSIPCFAPGDDTTRAQFVKMADIAFGIANYTPSSPYFSDVPASSWAYQYVESAYANHLISGYDAATCAANGVAYPCFLPNSSVTKGQEAVMIQRARVYPVYHPASPTFPDVTTTNAAWAYDAVETLVHQGVLDLDSRYSCRGCNFIPNRYINRDNTAVWVARAVLHIAPNP